jgi:hypothetical protein
MYVAQGLDSATSDVQTSMQDNLGELWNVIVANDVPKPLWISEYGWRANLVGPDEQAARMNAGFDAMDAFGHIALAVYFTFQDWPDNEWGVFDSAGTRRPSADMLKALADAHRPEHGAVVMNVQVPILAPGELGEAVVTLTNRGSATWTKGWRLGAAAGCPDAATYNQLAWEPVAGYASDVLDARVFLDGEVAPGESVDVRVPIRAPGTAGSYRFAARMVEEGVMWFGPTAVATVEVRDADSSTNTSTPTAGGGCDVGGGAGLGVVALFYRRRRRV